MVPGPVTTLKTLLGHISEHLLRQQGVEREGAGCGAPHGITLAQLASHSVRQTDGQTDSCGGGGRGRCMCVMCVKGCEGRGQGAPRSDVAN